LNHNSISSISWQLLLSLIFRFPGLTILLFFKFLKDGYKKCSCSLLLLGAIPFSTASPSFSTTLDKRQWKAGQGVKTASGFVQGRAAQNRTEVSEYLGIPFAKPPIGDLRWAAPVKFSGTGNINATAYVSTDSQFFAWIKTNF
jgi:hypothetical protein